MSSVFREVITPILSAVAASLITIVLTRIRPAWFRQLAPKRRRIKRDIESHINRELKETFQATVGLPVLRYRAAIEWSEKPDPSTYLTEDGDLVIKLSYEKDRNTSRSFVKALMLYLDESFIPEAKAFAGEVLHAGCKYNIAKEITFNRGAESYRHFVCDYLSPFVVNSEEAEQLLCKLESISKKKLFRIVLLRELYLVAFKGLLPSEKIREEVKEFVEFLGNVAEKEEYETQYGQEPPLGFIRTCIKTHIVLVRKKGVATFHGHINAAETAFRIGARTVYVTGWGPGNVDAVRYIAKRLRQKKYTQLGSLRFNVESADRVTVGECFVYERQTIQR